MAKEENPKCEKCGKEKPTTKYAPDPTNKPDETLMLCDECIIAGVHEQEPEKEKAVAKKPKAGQNKAEHIETKPIDRVDIQKKIAAQEKDIDVLFGKRQKIQQQLGQVNEILMSKKGAVAGLRDLLGDS